MDAKTGTISIYWAYLITFHRKTETESSLRNVMFYIKDRTIDNVENGDSHDAVNNEQKYVDDEGVDWTKPDWTVHVSCLVLK
jgi:hypothetical protein